MPERDYRLCRSYDVDGELGYDWLPGRFGPPPGIRRDRMRTIEAQTDDEFFRDFVRWSLEEKQSLMISERHRRRTFNCRDWPKTSPVDVDRLAAEGFFWTGYSDRAQCAFCVGFIGNWEPGDPPVDAQHRRFFPHCKRARRVPCPNIPYSPSDDRRGGDVGGLVNASVVATAATSGEDVAGLTNQPYHPRYQLYSSRLDSYRYYPRRYPLKAARLAEAGFFYEGPADKVRCFWCDGGLEDWEAGDDAWTEHARWYPGCRHVFLVKGATFIVDVRATTSADDLRRAADLTYNDAGTDFLSAAAADVDDMDVTDVDVDAGVVALARRQDWYVVLNGLGFTSDELDALARERVWQRDVADVDVARLIDLLLDRRDGVRSDGRSRVDAVVDALAEQLEWMNVLDDRHPGRRPPPTPPPKILDLRAVVAAYNDRQRAVDGEDVLIVAAMTCVVCDSRVKDSVTLPCGHLLYCSTCVAAGVTPNACLVCRRPTRGACRVYFG